MLDTGEVGALVDQVDAVVQEGCPVIRHDLVQVVDELLTVVGDDERAGVTTLGQKDLQEVGEGFLVAGELADGHVGVEPEQFALLVVVLAALPVGPGGIAAAQDAGGDGGVVGAAPVAARLVVQVGGGERQHVAVLRL